MLDEELKYVAPLIRALPWLSSVGAAANVPRYQVLYVLYVVAELVAEVAALVADVAALDADVAAAV